MTKRLLVLTLLFSFYTLSANSGDDFFVEKKVKIYPIPAIDYFTVEVTADYLSGKIIIQDLVGRQVLTKIIEEETKVKIATDQLVKGIYFVSIQVDTDIVFIQRISIDK